MNDELLAIIRERIVRYLQGDRADPSLILGENVTEASIELWRSAIRPPVPIEVIEIIALLYWLRYQALPTGQDRDDLQVATVMFAHIFKFDPESVPGELREFVSDFNNVLQMEDNASIPASHPMSTVDKAFEYALDIADTMIVTGPDWQIDKASAILQRASKDDSSANLGRAIALLQSAVGVLSHDHPDRADALARLSNAFELRFERAGNPADQCEAVEIARTAATEYPTSAVTLARLGVKLNNRGRNKKDPADHEAAIAAFRTALDNTSADDPSYVSLLASLAISLANKFDCTDSLPDLDAAVEAYQAAADAAPDDYPQRAKILDGLSRGRQMRSRRS